MGIVFCICGSKPVILSGCSDWKQLGIKTMQGAVCVGACCYKHLWEFELNCTTLQHCRAVDNIRQDFNCLNEIDKMGHRRLLCPHLYGDLSPPQHPGSSCCTRQAYRVLSCAYCSIWHSLIVPQDCFPRFIHVYVCVCFAVLDFWMQCLEGWFCWCKSWARFKFFCQAITAFFVLPELSALASLLLS